MRLDLGDRAAVEARLANQPLEGIIHLAAQAGVRYSNTAFPLAAPSFVQVLLETEYVISWLPLGGYVKMAGMEEMEKIEGGTTRTVPADIVDGGLVSDAIPEDSPADLATGAARARGPRDFESKSIAARVLVISAGMLMNLLFAIVVFSIISYVWGIERSFEPRIARVRAERLPDGTKSLAAIPPNARLVAIGDRAVDDWNNVRSAIVTGNPGEVLFHFDQAPDVAVTIPEKDSLKASSSTHSSRKAESVLCCRTCPLLQRGSSRSIASPPSAASPS